jgi:hypothetical protein
MERRTVWNPTLRKGGEGWGTHGNLSYRKSGKRRATRRFFRDRANSLMRSLRDKNARDPKGSLDFARDFACGAQTPARRLNFDSAPISQSSYSHCRGGASLRKNRVGSVGEGGRPECDVRLRDRVLVDRKSGFEIPNRYTIPGSHDLPALALTSSCFNL